MNLETVLHAIAVVTVLSVLSISIYFRHQAARSGEKISVHEEGFLILNLRRIFGLALWMSVFTYLINPSWMAWSSLPLPFWARGLGAGLMLVCVPLLYWMFYSLGRNITPTVVTRQQHSLVTHGPYRWIRHPLYTFAFLFFAGLSLLAASWFMVLVLILGSPVLLLRTPIEEQRLIERFGDQYREYMQHTGRYLPRWKGLFGVNRS